MLLPFTKAVFEKLNYMVLDGKEQCDFVALKGVPDPNKYVLWKEKAFAGFNMIVEEGTVLKFSTLKARGLIKRLNDLYYDYNLYNAGILIYFAETGEIKYLTWDRAKAFLDHAINMVNSEYLLDLDFYTVDLGTTHSYLNSVRGDITMTGAQARATLLSDARRLKRVKRERFGGK